MRWIHSLAALAIFAWACDDPVAPTSPAGDLAIVITLPTAAEGAIVLTLTGPVLPPPDSFRAADGLLRFARAGGARGEAAVSIALFGEIRSGEILRFPVPDTEQADAYRATVTEVAGPDYGLRAQPGAYPLTVRAPTGGI